MEGTNHILKSGRIKRLPLILTFIAITLMLICAYANFNIEDKNKQAQNQYYESDTEILQEYSESVIRQIERQRMQKKEELAQVEFEQFEQEELRQKALYEEELHKEKITDLLENEDLTQETNTAHDPQFKNDYDEYLQKSHTGILQRPQSPPSLHNEASSKTTRRDNFKQALISPTRIEFGKNKPSNGSLVESTTQSLGSAKSFFNDYEENNANARVNQKHTRYINTAGNRSNLLDDYKIFDKADDFELAQKVMALKSPWCLRQGSVIPAVLTSAINSDLPGLVTAQTTSDVLDSITGSEILIPKGTKITGEYMSSPGFGQERLFIGFQRLLFPDGSSLKLGSMPGQSADGNAGFDADVDNHIMKLVGSAMLLSTISAAVSSTQNRNYDAYGRPTYGDSLAADASSSLGSVLSRIIERNLSLSPTLNVKPGYVFCVAVAKDIYFTAPWGDQNFALKGKHS